jgi:hypothetical protein
LPAHKHMRGTCYTHAQLPPPWSRDRRRETFLKRHFNVTVTFRVTALR